MPLLQAVCLCSWAFESFKICLTHKLIAFGSNTARSLEELCTWHKFPRDPIASVSLPFWSGDFWVSFWLPQVCSVLFGPGGCCGGSPACTELVVLRVIPWFREEVTPTSICFPCHALSLYLATHLQRRRKLVLPDRQSIILLKANVGTYLESRLLSTNGRVCMFWYSVIEQFHSNKFNKKC